MRLNLSSLPSLAATIQRPAFNPAALGIGIVHLGIGAFHRAHQTRYGHADASKAVEIVSLRLRASGLTEKPMRGRDSSEPSATSRFSASRTGVRLTRSWADRCTSFRRSPSASGMGQQIARCPRCRIALWSHYAGSGSLTRFVRVGTLDAPDALPPDIHIYTSTKQPWVTLPPAAKAVAEFYDPAEVWTPETRAQHEAVGQAMRKAADQAVPLAKALLAGGIRVLEVTLRTAAGYFRRAVAERPTWSPDGRYLAWSTDRAGGHLQIWIRDMQTGQMRQLTHITTQPTSLQFSPDGKRIAFVAWVWPGLRGNAAQAKRLKAFRERKESAYVTSEAQYRYWDHSLPMGRVG